ncbi:MAG: hypothetical protein IPK16_25535 [Anaerolineales bacterium]|nr:hypothetical protein [Anaerolineales bacterium]
MIRRRAYVATDGDFGSLDAISSPELRDVETTLARIPKPLPRELIWLVNQLLYVAAQRTDGELLRLEQDDVTRVAAPMPIVWRSSIHFLNMRSSSDRRQS